MKCKLIPRASKPLVAKVRRDKEQAYGTYGSWMELRARVIKRDGNKCRRCCSPNHLQVDHIIPVARGGKSIMANLWTLCAFCHAKRPGHRSARHLILHKTKDKNAVRYKASKNSRNKRNRLR